MYILIQHSYHNQIYINIGMWHIPDLFISFTLLSKIYIKAINYFEKRNLGAFVNLFLFFRISRAF